MSELFALNREIAAEKAFELYTPEERKRRDETIWTVVQGILAPLQFLVFLVSLFLVFRALQTGEGHALAHASIIVKTLILYAIMITGSIWEKVVFGKYLFAKPFFWEDVFSMLVLALHTAYLAFLFSGTLTDAGLLTLALAAYAAYVINAGQFIWKLRQARLQSRSDSGGKIGQSTLVEAELRRESAQKHDSSLRFPQTNPAKSHLDSSLEGAK